LGLTVLALSTVAAAAAAADEKAGHGGDAHAAGSSEPAPHDAHGGHHNESDLSHDNGGAKLKDPDEFKSDLAIYTFAVFVLLLLILGKFAWGPIVAGLDKREKSIADKIEEAKNAAEEAKLQLQRHEAQLAGASEEVRQLLDKGRRDADAVRQQILDEAEKAAQAEKNRALREIALAKNEALTQLAEKSVDTAVDLAGRIVRRQLTAADHAELIQQALERFPSEN